MKLFDTTLRDSQSSAIKKIPAEMFDLEKYRDYVDSLQPKIREFSYAKNGLLIYRRFRADGVFYDKCKDYTESLELQLGALEASMSFKADIPNFLEPWYGIGYIGASFGGKYSWSENQAPNMEPVFSSCAELLSCSITPIHKTEEGNHILNSIEYFLDKTKGRLPISFADVQSPLNMMSYLMSMDNLFYELYDNEDDLQKVLELITELLAEFLIKQKSLIGENLVLPGHGFASSKWFKGLGQSDDNSLMVSPKVYSEIFKPYTEKLGQPYGGVAFHSCGNWENKIETVQGIKGIVCADAAFSRQTDPSPNDASVFAKKFTGKNIVLNARAVGENAFEHFAELLKTKNIKLIAVSYMKNVQSQAELYDKLHSVSVE